MTCHTPMELRIAAKTDAGAIISALIRHLINECRTPKLFTSTNQSNFPMQRLLATLGFDRSSFIENLDEGDPEWVYFKRLRDNAT